MKILSHICSRDHLAAGSLAVILMMATGCGDGTAVQADNTIQFTPLERKSVTTETIDDPGPPISEQDEEKYQPILEGFRENADQLFERGDIADRLEQIERVFVSSGNYLELIGIYQRAVEEHGLKTPAAERLAWGYIRLGQTSLARDLLDRLQETKPDEATTWFLNGSYWMAQIDQPETSSEPAARAVLAWERALELGGDFSKFSRVDTQRLRQEIDALKSRLPESPEAIVAGADESEAGEQPADEPEADEQPTDEPEADEQPTDEPEADEQPADEPEAREQPVQPGREPVQVLIARAELATASGRYDEARRVYQQVLERAPENVDARFGLAQVQWESGEGRAEAAETVEALADEADLTAEQAYELGVFALDDMKNPQLATELLERVQKLDSDYARSRDVESLLEEARN